MEKSQYYKPRPKKVLPNKKQITLSPAQEKQSEELVNAIYQHQFWNFAANEHSHIARHTDSNETEALNRIYNEGKACIGIFTNEEQAHEIIGDILAANMKSIVAWLDSANNRECVEFDEVYELEDDEPAIGHLYYHDSDSHHLTEYNTDFYKIVLERDNRTKFGFVVTTVYPQLPRDYTQLKPTNRDLTPFVQQTDAYKHASPTKQTYMEFCANPNRPNLFVRHTKPDNGHDESLKIKIPSKTNPTDEHIIHMNADKMELHTVRNRKTVLSEYNENAKYVNLLSESAHNKFAVDYPIEMAYIDSLYRTIQARSHLPKQSIKTAQKPIPTTVIEDNMNSHNDYTPEP